MKARILVSGKVQGVGYRNFVRLIALRNRAMGIVRNLKNGTVEIFVEAEGEKFESFVNSLKPKNDIVTTAIVKDVKLNPEGSEEYAEAWDDYRGKFLIDRVEIK